MIAAPLPRDERLRQSDLDGLNVIDTPADETYDRIVRIACAAFGMPIGMVSLVDRERQWFKARIGLDDEETPREQSFCAHAIHGDHVMVIEDASLDARFHDNPLVTKDGGIRFYAGAPLQLRSGQRVGTLCLIDHKPRTLEGAQRALLRDMAAVVASELELRRTAGTDQLTGLYTRRMIDDLGYREFSRARRQDTPLSVAMIDLDRFKQINDGFGHAAGDAVLRAIGPACRTALRTHDLLGRYGGEEIVAVLPGAALDEAGDILQRVRQAIEEMDVPELGARWVVSASIGVAELEPHDACLANILLRADAALYRAKDGGRNRVEMNAA